MTEADDVGKLFVGGLSWETTQETLQSYFSRFGEVVDCVVMKNNETGRSRGFGFVTFKDPQCVGTVLQTKPHELNGRTVDAKECTPRSQQKNKGRGSAVQGKIFLGGLPPDVTENDIRGVMSQFGKVNQVTIMSDQETKKCRGFGFLSFESEDSIEQACSQRFVNLNGKQIECKRAEPRENNQRRNGGQQYQNGGGRQDYGGGDGGYQGGWNQPAQQYGMQQGQAYGGGGGYQNYNAMASSQYGASAAGYSAMQPAAQYGQPAYPSYGGYAYAQPTAAAGYTQPAQAAYGQAQGASYTSAAPVADATKSPTSYGGYAAAGGAGGAARGQGYHPYRR
ncbi:hypothetical protein JTE90_028446 [Oedothorax gibbosus]|uniref:RRM domain-containing protein n=1 Tax=Oedothorax gibbosus TaxID=931172 RepID=A0AAV6VFB3_9ARAC|nr:hypothetical protein JTE90_028446 [Oedothorax gibbosus]